MRPLHDHDLCKHLGRVERRLRRELEAEVRHLTPDEIAREYTEVRITQLTNEANLRQGQRRPLLLKGDD